MKYPKIYFILTAVILLLVQNFSFAQGKDVIELRRIFALKDASEQLTELKKFTVDFSNSPYLGRAVYTIFTIYLDSGNADSALVYASRYVNAYPPEARMAVYNEAAWQMAKSGIGLDSAKVYADQAVKAARNNNPARLSMYLDTQALVEYKLGNAKDALAIEAEAIKGNETKTSYLVALAKYQYANGEVQDALNTVAKGCLYEGIDPDNVDIAGESYKLFDEWIGKSEGSEKEKQKLKKQVVDEVIKEYMDSAGKEDKQKSEAFAAMFLAKTGVNLDQAEKWAKGAVDSFDKMGSIEDLLKLKVNLAVVYIAEGKYKSSISLLAPLEKFATAWDSNFWVSLGEAYEKNKQNDLAAEAYISGLVAYKFPPVVEASKGLFSKMGIDENKLDQKIETMKKEMESFDPGTYKPAKKSTGKVVLAELFTGAECPPCVAADQAFDELSKYYPRNDLVILEYHVHIPGPDPITNPDTYDRYRYYGGNFGTPTVFFEGKEKITGGGPSFLTKNRFYVFDDLIQKGLMKKPELKIDGSAKLTNDNINVAVKITPSKGAKPEDNLSLHIALVEKVIGYTGGNGISKHIFVVRHLVDGAIGSELKIDNGALNVDKSINVGEVEKGIKSYLDQPDKYPAAWNPNLQFTGWRERPDTLDRNDLAVVVWVQNNSTKEVYQAAYFDVQNRM